MTYHDNDSMLDQCEGQTLVEYALIISLVVLVVIGLLSILGTTLIDAYYNQVIQAFPGN